MKSPISEFKKRLRLRQRVRYKTKGLMSKPIICKCVITSGTFLCRTPQNKLKQQHEMTKFKFYGVRVTHDGEYLILCLNLNVIPTNYICSIAFRWCPSTK